MEVCCGFRGDFHVGSHLLHRLWCRGGDSRIDLGNALRTDDALLDCWHGLSESGTQADDLLLCGDHIVQHDATVPYARDTNEQTDCISRFASVGDSSWCISSDRSAIGHSLQ